MGGLELIQDATGWEAHSKSVTNKALKKKKYMGHEHAQQYNLCKTSHQKRQKKCFCILNDVFVLFSKTEV